MYGQLLLYHSWIRWLALVAAIGTTFAAVRRQDATAERWALIAQIMLDVQMLIGLLLYTAFSPVMKEILANVDAAMKDPAARFWAVEHITAMMLAVAAAHVGRVLARKAKTADAKCKRLLICFGIATVLIMAGMPWPNRVGGRPLFRF